MQWKRVLSCWRRTRKCYAVNSVVVHSYFPGHDILNTHNFLGCWARSEEQQSCSTKDAGSMPILVMVFLCPCAIEIYGFSPYPLMVYFIFSSFLLQQTAKKCNRMESEFSSLYQKNRSSSFLRSFLNSLNSRLSGVLSTMIWSLFPFIAVCRPQPSRRATPPWSQVTRLHSHPNNNDDGRRSVAYSLVLCRLRSQYHPTWWVMTTSIF